MKLVWIVLLLLLPLSTIAAEGEESEGDEKIADTIKKIQEEEKAREGGGSSSEEDDDDEGCGGCDFFGDLFFELLGELLGEYMRYISFAPYPYSDEVDYDFSTFLYQDRYNRKITSINLAADLSTHFDGTYGNTNRLTAQLSALQLNFFNQTIFASSVSLSTLSLNAGLSLLFRNFDFSIFAGMYQVTTTGTFMFSAGLSSRVFFPFRLYLDLYSLYGFLSENTGILHLIGSLNYAIWRFSIGVGYNYNLIAGDVYAGPCVKISFWL